MILDQKVFQRVKDLGFYQSVGLVQQADSIEVLADEIQVNADQLVQTINEWNEDVANKKTPNMDVKRECIRSMQLLFMRFMWPLQFITQWVELILILKPMFLIKTGKSSQVYLQQAAGGLHGNNRVGGNSIAETVVFGRQAGIQASRF